MAQHLVEPEARTSWLRMLGQALGFIYGGPLLPNELPLWAAATTMNDLCHLTERWLVGELKSQPGYYGAVDVDEQDAPGLTAALVALNRFGFLTDGSQAGCAGMGYNECFCHQLAAVTGFARPESVDELRKTLIGTPFVLAAFERVRRYGSVIPVTWIMCGEAPKVVTRFGGGLRPSDVRFLFNGAGTSAVEEVTAAQQVVIYDPEPGRNDLWAFLSAAVGR